MTPSIRLPWRWKSAKPNASFKPLNLLADGTLRDLSSPAAAKTSAPCTHFECAHCFQAPFIPVALLILHENNSRSLHDFSSFVLWSVTLLSDCNTCCINCSLEEIEMQSLATLAQPSTPITTHPVYCEKLAKYDFVHLSPETFLREIDDLPQHELESFRDRWNSLEVDQYMADGGTYPSASARHVFSHTRGRRYRTLSSPASLPDHNL